MLIIIIIFIFIILECHNNKIINHFQQYTQNLCSKDIFLETTSLGNFDYSQLLENNVLSKNKLQAKFNEINGHLNYTNENLNALLIHVSIKIYNEILSKFDAVKNKKPICGDEYANISTNYLSLGLSLNDVNLMKPVNTNNESEDAPIFKLDDKFNLMKILVVKSGDKCKFSNNSDKSKSFVFLDFKKEPGTQLLNYLKDPGWGISMSNDINKFVCISVLIYNACIKILSQIESRNDNCKNKMSTFLTNNKNYIPIDKGFNLQVNNTELFTKFINLQKHIRQL